MSSSNMITIGEKLDPQGKPRAGTGFLYEPDGPIAELLEKRTSPIISQPQTGEWLFGLVTAEETGGEYASGVVIFRPGNMGPPEHIHPSYDEHFHILVGEFLFIQNGEKQIARPGDKIIIKRGIPHTFRCISDRYGALIGETRPSARTTEVIATLFGMAHEGKLGPKGQPKFLHGMVIGEEFGEDTVFTSPPPVVVNFLVRVLAPVGRMLGYQATYPHYMDESFWEKHVNQP